MKRQIRPEVAAFIELGPLPSSDTADETHVTRLGDALAKITAPVSREEALLLASSFGADECFGLAWTLVHLIETAPGGTPLDGISAERNEWTRLLFERAGRGG